ncbi:hypothetical protein AL755_10640 [Arthrobacter sp. ERGS1:01]|uniref:hypothetical protein n=1 Tax=Arthrobacter sp. ERGS1:01 TaxID=1704044 RepID=UPI0006B52E04|nr:hypothetical protein [Arthrobacter sp. ERGS1:01]ALE05820.1 hypothetical protein AL755_10640 [Arthrobacter sp. ERGS1:01]
MVIAPAASASIGMAAGISVTVGYGQVSSWLNKWDDLKQDQGGVEDAFSAEGIDNRIIRHRLLRFFEDCWHLVDWVKEDEELPDINEEVETEALDDDAMRVCRAVALVSKHHTLRTTARTPEREKAYVKDVTFSSGRPSARV